MRIVNVQSSVMDEIRAKVRLNEAKLWHSKLKNLKDPENWCCERIVELEAKLKSAQSAS